MEATLSAVCYSEDTTGILCAGALKVYSIELPWNNNDPDSSCVPAGTYQLIPYQSPTHGWTYCLHNLALNIYGPSWITGIDVPPGGRTYVELHSANFVRQLLGCIALGIDDEPMLDPATGKNEPAVENSANAVEKLLEILGTNVTGHILTITRSGLYPNPHSGA